MDMRNLFECIAIPKEADGAERFSASYGDMGVYFPNSTERFPADAEPLAHLVGGECFHLILLRGPLVHPRPNLGYLRVDLFERIAQRGQRLEQVVPVKAPEVDGAGVPGVFEKGQPCPHPGGPLRPAGGIGSRLLDVPHMPGKDMEPGIQIPFRACGESALLRVVRASVDPTVDLLDLLAKIAKLRKRFRLEE